jgi:phage pi2 protein 07
MHKLFKQWFDAQDVASKAREAVRVAEAAAELIELPENLRTAIASDIVEGGILWYPECHERKWTVISEVHKPSSMWKAYTGHDGCRYGLDGAYVEIAN